MTQQSPAPTTPTLRREAIFHRDNTQVFLGGLLALCTIAGMLMGFGTAGVLFHLQSDSRQPTMTYSQIAPAWLGVSVVTDSLSAGVQTVQKSSPADALGLRPGDRIERVGKQHVFSHKDLVRTVRSHEPGDIVEVEAVRGSERVQGTVRLGRMPYALYRQVASIVRYQCVHSSRVGESCRLR